MALVAIIMVLLGLINIGSTTAFNAMVSLTVIGQYTSYTLSITLLLIRKFNPKLLPLGPFKLPTSIVIIINSFSIAFGVLIICLSTLPPYQPVTAQNMNYASVVFGAVILLSIVSWFIFGRRIYSGPVREVIENADVKKAVE